MSKHIALYDNHLEFEILDKFEIMDSCEKKKFFNGEVPENVYYMAEKQALITVSRQERTLNKDDIEKRLNEYYYAYSRSAANFANTKMAKKKLDNGNVIGTFHFSSTTVERDLLNFVVLMCVAGSEVLMTMHCDTKDSMELGKAFMKTLDSIRVK